MEDKINQYHLHKDDYSKLHLELKDINQHLSKFEDSVFKAHRHTYFMFIWFKDEGTHFVDYEGIDHPANSLFLLNRNQVHYFCANASNNGVLYQFDEIFLSRGRDDYRQRIVFQLFNEVGAPFLILDEETVEVLNAVTPLLRSEIEAKKYNYKEMIFSYMQTLVIAVERLKHSKIESHIKNEVNQELAILFKRHVEFNIDKFLSLNEYSVYLGISEKKLSTISNDYFLMSPAKYVAYRKILEAKRILSNVNISIKEVAYSLGFDQPTYFTKYFKKHTTQTPREFVNKICS